MFLMMTLMVTSRACSPYGGLITRRSTSLIVYPQISMVVIIRLLDSFVKLCGATNSIIRFSIASDAALPSYIQ